MNPVPLQTNQEREGQIQLLQLCDPVARLCLIFRTSVRKANLFSYILKIQNVFVLLNISLIKRVMIKSKFQCYLHFTLV